MLWIPTLLYVEICQALMDLYNLLFIHRAKLNLGMTRCFLLFFADKADSSFLIVLVMFISYIFPIAKPIERKELWI